MYAHIQTILMFFAKTFSDYPALAALPNNADNGPNNAPPAAAAALDQAAGHAGPSLNSERDKLIFLLLNSGTHLDACNAAGKTAADLYKGGKMYQIINPINFLSLQCLAAKVIQSNRIEYRSSLTEELANFVSIH